MEERLLAARHALPQAFGPPLRGARRFYDFQRLQQRRDPAGQHPVRPPGLWPGQSEQRIGTLDSEVLNARLAQPGD